MKQRLAFAWQLLLVDGFSQTSLFVILHDDEFPTWLKGIICRAGSGWRIKITGFPFQIIIEVKIVQIIVDDPKCADQRIDFNHFVNLPVRKAGRTDIRPNLFYFHFAFTPFSIASCCLPLYSYQWILYLKLSDMNIAHLLSHFQSSPLYWRNILEAARSSLATLYPVKREYS